MFEVKNKQFLLKLVMLFLFTSLVSFTTITVHASGKDKADTDVNVTLREDKDTGKGKGKIEPKKPSQYETISPKELSYLPKTGELIQNFFIILIGVSLLLFSIILYINKLYANQIRWDMNI